MTPLLPVPSLPPIELVQLDQLVAIDVTVDPTAPTQRVLTEKRVAKLAAAFDLTKVGALTVNRRPDGRLVVLDGQARAAAAQRVGITHLPAIVHRGLDVAAEAGVFLAVNRDNTATSVADNYAVGLTSGEPVYVATDRVLKAHGLAVSSSATSSANRVSAIAALVRIVAKEPDGEAVLDAALGIAEAAWGRTARTWDGMILGGLARFIRKHPDANRVQLARKLSGIGVPELVVSKIVTRASVGSTQHTGTGGREAAAYGLILDAYNRGRRDKLVAL